MNFSISSFVDLRINQADKKFQENSFVYHKELDKYMKVIKSTEVKGEEALYKCEIVEEQKDEDEDKKSSTLEVSEKQLTQYITVTVKVPHMGKS
jgi:hypothetical protein